MDKLFLARLAMNVLQNPKADRAGIDNAKSIIEDLIMKGGNVRIPQFKDAPSPRKRKLSAWQKYIKNKRNHIKYRDGKLNLKKMGVEFRRKKRR